MHPYRTPLNPKPFFNPDKYPQGPFGGCHGHAGDRVPRAILARLEQSGVLGSVAVEFCVQGFGVWGFRGLG